ncbi:hypothetical protein LDENG_00190610 [Lucifuga dentata]|nr:hypothetical protein LDENG_00190610 [Lucifuga dentata]
MWFLKHSTQHRTACHVLSWLKPHLSAQSQHVLDDNITSRVKYGVPQGSIIGPLLFSLYISPLGQIICSYGINFHCYADDTQLHVPLRVENYCHLSKLKACLVAVKNWMLTNFLLLNSDKIEMLVIGLTKHRHLYNRLNISLDNCLVTQSRTGKILGVVADTNLSFHDHINEITKTAFFHLCNIAKIRSCLFKEI